MIEIEQFKQQFENSLVQVGLESLLERAECIKKAKSFGDADVYRLEVSGGNVLLKSYHHRLWIIRRLLAGSFLRHEQKILRMLQKDGKVRAPRPFGIVQKDTIAMEFFSDASTLKGAHRYTAETMPSREFFLELIQCIRHLHDMGIAHGDLRRGNVMIDREGHVRIIDVATACHGGKKGNWFRRFLFSMIRRSDNYSLAKIVRSYYPDLVDDELQYFIVHAPWYLRFGRFLRQKIYRPLRGK